MCKPVCISLVYSKDKEEVKVFEYFASLMCLKDLEGKGEKKEKPDMEKSLDCPLCLEPLEMDDKNFFPCACDYQVCRFCWHRIKTTENGLCPACRRIYPENPANFVPLTPEELQKYKQQKKMKELQRKQKSSENKKQLANVRVIQKNLVFAVGLPLELSHDNEKKEKVLQMFRHYGPIQKETITDRTNYAGAQGPSACVYITYQRPEDAIKAVKLLTNTKIEGRTIKVSLGTTKYCSNFLKGVHCPKAECLYLHELADEEASFTKEDIHAGKHLDYEAKLLDPPHYNSSSHNKLSAPNNENSRVNHIHNQDDGSDSDDVHQNNSCGSSDVSELSPSGNPSLQIIRNNGSDVNSENESNHQNIHLGNPELRTNTETPSKSIFRSENVIINNSNFQDTLNPGFRNLIQKTEAESLQQPNILNNQIYESASKRQTTPRNRIYFGIISNRVVENGKKKLEGSNMAHEQLDSESRKQDDNPNLVSEFLNMEHEQLDSGPRKRDDDPDLEFDPCQESLDGLQDLLISEAKERARIHYNAMNRSPLSNRSPTLSSVQTFDNMGYRNSSFPAMKSRDPPPGFSNNCTQNILYKPSYETATSLLNKSALPMHNQVVRTNYSIQRYPQPGVSVNNSFIPDYTAPVPVREIPEFISPVVQPVVQQHNQRLMNMSQVQYPISEQRSSPLWNNTSQSQWWPSENVFFNQGVSEGRATNDFSLRMPARSNEASIRQWQQIPATVNNFSQFQEHPPLTPEQVAKVQVLKAVEAAQRNSPSFGHRLQYTKKL